MRKILIIALAAGLMGMALTGFMAAQEPSAPSNPPNEAAPGNREGGGNVQKRLQNLSKQLNLTDEQKTKIRPLLRRELERIKEVRQNSSLTQAQARRRIAAIRRETNQHITQFLTPEQKQQWQELRDERRAGGPQGGPGGPAGPGSQGGREGSVASEPPASPPNPPNPQ